MTHLARPFNTKLTRVAEHHGRASCSHFDDALSPSGWIFPGLSAQNTLTY